MSKEGCAAPNHLQHIDQQLESLFPLFWFVVDSFTELSESPSEERRRMLTTHNRDGPCRYAVS
jgi:hypothetical protein